ncbi:unnamed protein product, partial [Musa acuminata var. zebrina]
MEPFVYLACRKDLVQLFDKINRGSLKEGKKGKVLPAKGKVPFLARGVWKGFGPKKHSMRTLCQIVCASRNTKSSITHLCV